MNVFNTRVNPIAQAMYARRARQEINRLRCGVGVIILREDGAILMERRADNGTWGLPGGSVDAGESLRETVSREVREETGLEVEITGFVGIYSDPARRVVTYLDNGDVTQRIDVVVEARITGGTLGRSAESEELCFFLLSDLPKDVTPLVLDPLEDYRHGRRGVLA
jgi:ADP-ribose pyrophosphatase YjhB (NUDIX family)